MITEYRISYKKKTDDINISQKMASRNFYYTVGSRFPERFLLDMRLVEQYEAVKENKYPKYTHLRLTPYCYIFLFGKNL